MYDQSKDLLDALRAGTDVLEGLLVGCGDDEARAARGGDEGWSVVEVVCHLRDAEERAAERVRMMLAEVEPFLAAYDQNVWARERDYAGATLRPAVAAFARFRAAHVAQLEGLDAGGWARTGRHEEQGTITIASHALHMASHDASHGAQIARALDRARGAAAPHG